MPASDYNSLIPQPTDQLNISQGQILLNFGAIPALIDVDHVDFAAVGAGKHNKVTFPVQTLAPAFIAGEVGLYNLLYGTTNTNELYFNSTSGVNYPITASILSVNPNPGFVPGWTTLPSGLILKWGTSIATGSTTYTFPVAGNIPVFNGLAGLTVTTVGINTDSFVQLITTGPTQFTVNATARTTNTVATTGFSYLAIGY